MQHQMNYGKPDEHKVYEAIAGALNGKESAEAAGIIALLRYELNKLYTHVMSDEVDSEELVTITCAPEEEAEEPAEEGDK